MIRRAKKLSMNAFHKAWNGMILIHGTKKSIINAVTQEAILLGEIDQEGNRLYEYQQLKKATFHRKFVCG
jgi:hypothetical protein